MGVSQNDTECEGSDAHGDGPGTDGGEPGEGPPTLDDKDSPSVTEIYDRWTEHKDTAEGEEAEIEALRKAMDAAGVDVPDELDESAAVNEGAANEKSDDGVGQWTNEGETVAAESEAAAAESEAGAEAADTDPASEEAQPAIDADEPTDSGSETIGTDGTATVEPSAETIRDGDAGTVERVVDPEVGRVVNTYGHAGGASVTTVPISETRVGDEE